MRIIRAGALLAVPWKNGGGVTREVAVWPPGAGFDGFDWRLSMADITQDGPFSVLPGVDRTLIVMEGAGLVLEGVAPRPLNAGDRADFPGEAAVTGHLTAGPVRDLNLMLRRGRVAGEVMLNPPDGALALPWPEALVVVREGVAQLGGKTLHRQDTAHFAPGHPPDVALSGGAQVIVIGLTPLFSAAPGR
jgi:environmental stress-induced protein Ves